MNVNYPHSIDRSYKFMYKQLDIKFHRYLYGEGDKIEFIQTEIPDTGQRMDITAKVDDEHIQITEFMANALDNDKLRTLFDYHNYMRNNPSYEDLKVKSDVISIANPNHGANAIEIDKNITFHTDVEFFKNRNGREVLNTIFDKIVSQKELSDNEAIDLLILPDMDINIPIKGLMTIIIALLANANIPDTTFKRNVYCCLIKVLARFFKDQELDEMKEMLKTLTKDQKLAYLVENYGGGFGQIYIDGIEDGMSKGFEDGKNQGFEDGKNQGFADAKQEDAEKLLSEGVDEEIISRCTGISIEKLEELKRKL